MIDTSVLVTTRRRRLRLSHLLAALPNPVTENLEHFQRIPGLAVAAPRWP